MKQAINKVKNTFVSVVGNNRGDQMTGWLIMVLIVVVVGAAFMTLYQGSITELWTGIVDKAKATFGI